MAHNYPKIVVRSPRKRVLAEEEGVVFDPGFVAVVLRHEKVITEALAHGPDLTFTGYCILQELMTYGERIPAASFQSYLALKPAAVTAATRKLEDCGYLLREHSPLNARAMVLSTTPLGREAASCTTELIVKGLAESVWRGFTREKVLAGIAAYVKPLHDTGMQRLQIEGDEYHLVPEWLIGMKRLKNEWSYALHRECDLSLNECLLLVLLDREVAGVSPKDAACVLGLNRSAISHFAKHLQAEGYVDASQSQTDKRCFSLWITGEGRRVLVRGVESLEAVSARHFGGISEESVGLLNDIHRMMAASIGF